MGAKTRAIEVSDHMVEEYNIDLSNRAVSPCNKCLVSAMCKKLCPDVTDYFFDHETYDRAVERTLIQCASNMVDTLELRAHRRGESKRWIIRTHKGRIQSFEQRKVNRMWPVHEMIETIKA